MKRLGEEEEDVLFVVILVEEEKQGGGVCGSRDAGLQWAGVHDAEQRLTRPC